MKKNYYLRGNRWSKKKIDKQTKRLRSVLVTNVPLVSVFLIMENSIVSRGVALCSDSDNCEKYIGRWLAHINAVEARDSRKSTKKIQRSEAINVLDKVTQFSISSRIKYGFGYRSEYDPVLTQYEKELMDIPAENGAENGWDTGEPDPVGDIKAARDLLKRHIL